MALISCPQCKKPISDKAILCPKCNYNQKNKLIICPECKEPIIEKQIMCNQCGYLMISEMTTKSSNSELKLEMLEYLAEQTKNNDVKVEGHKKELDATISRWIKLLSTIIFIISAAITFYGYNTWEKIKDDIGTRKELLIT